jgi:DNA-binding MarR family transcriptional regulator
MPSHRTAFLLSQLGAYSAEQYRDLVASLGLTPSDAGILRLLSRNPSISQRELADRLGTVPSRVVVLIDSLESRHLVARTRSASDRRNYELSLTDSGAALMQRLRAVSEEHDEAVLGALTDAQREQLHGLLSRLAETRDVDTEVHVGYGKRDPSGS